MRQAWFRCLTRCGALLFLASGTPAASSERAPLPWYMQETALTADGRQIFVDKPWWDRAKRLNEGESFTLDLNGDSRPDTLIYLENGNLVEAIDDTGKAENIRNRAHTCYLVSFKATGLVDRMVAYIDNNNDGKADEIDYRYYRDGYLRYAWFTENYDNDGAEIMQFDNWVYAGENGTRNKFRGNEMIYLNKYDPATGTWVPLSECPFAFWDEDHDGRSEIVLRVSAAPLGSNDGGDPDYANNYDYLWSPAATPFAKMGNMNVRLGYNVEPAPRSDPINAPHYNFGFTLVGQESYQYPRMSYTNPRRRPPQTVVRIPWDAALAVALRYPAQQTGFSWDEARVRTRWEGVFWISERRYLPNTGGPTYRWNQRREYSSRLTPQRELYYSDVDKRYHLEGASEGWLEVGHLVSDRKDLEFRYFDSDHDGRLDTWQVLLGDNPLPVRTSHVSPRAKRVPLTRSVLVADYNDRILPRAIAESSNLIAALKELSSSPLAQAYEAEAANTSWPERRRYCLDVARELYFLEARDRLYRKIAALPYARLEPSPKWSDLISAQPGREGYSLGDSLKYWKAAMGVEALVEHYGAGQLVEAQENVEELVRAGFRGKAGGQP